MFSLEGTTRFIHEWLNQHFSPDHGIIYRIGTGWSFAITLFALLGLGLVLMERKVAAVMQIRLGPNRVGPKGIFQTTADTLKLLMKEGLVPDGADKFLIQPGPVYCHDRCYADPGAHRLCKKSPDMGY